MEKKLQIISASAGSGKTYTLTQMLLSKISCGDLSPEQLIAVTFTEAGATELRGRIRAALLEQGLFNAAQHIDGAYISTIHAFGKRLLRESAFELGFPLSTRMLNEDEQTQLIRASMVNSPTLSGISANLDAYGYKTVRSGEKFVSAEDVFRTQLRVFIDLIRSTGRQCVEEDFLAASKCWLEEAYGTIDTTRSEEDFALTMHSRVVDLLREFPHCPVELFGITAAGPASEFRHSYRILHTAAKFDPLLSDWSLWAQLGKLKVSFKGSNKAPRYDRFKVLASAVVETAAQLLEIHPGPLRQVKEQLSGLLLGAGETLDDYARRKKQARLMDYTDMIASAEQAFRDGTALDRYLKAIRLVVVDEFQDTNPVQFAFLWHLIGAGVPSCLVGDIKQSIMGFQGADPRLFNALLSHPHAVVGSLQSNWRSQPRLLDVINCMTQGLCSPDGMNTAYQPLAARGVVSSLTALHMIVIEDKPDSNRSKKDTELGLEIRRHPPERVWNARQIAQVVKKKLSSSIEVVDRKSGKGRAIRGSDIAILCPTNAMLGVYARELERVGLLVNLERQGWFQSPEVQLSLQLLKLVANPADKHARLVVACSDLGQMQLQQALDLELKRGGLHLPVFDTLTRLGSEHGGAAIKTIVGLVFEQTDLFEIVARWKDGVQARANLIKLVGMASEFSSAPAEMLASAGFYGRGIATFLGWLYFNKDRHVDDACPRASYQDLDAVELTTWHKSKGREWPIVVVCGLDKSPIADVPSAGIGYLDMSDFDSLIKCSRIEFTPKVDVEAKRESMLAPLRADAEKAALRELYVALSRPREQLVLEWLPTHLDSDTKVRKRIQLLQGLCQIEVGDTSVKICGETFDAEINRVRYAWAPDQNIGLAGAPLNRQFGRIALEKGRVNVERQPAQVTPSTVSHDYINRSGSAPPLPVLEIKAVGKPLELGKPAKADALGTLVHRAIELVLSGRDDVELYCQRLEKALSGFLSAEQIRGVWSHARDLKAYLLAVGFDEGFLCEVPVLGSSDGKSVVVGTIDLIAEGKRGGLIIDHKTDSRVGSPSEVWVIHQSQLSAYQQLLPDFGIALNMVRSGELIKNVGS